MFPCSNGLADPNSGGYPSFGSLSLTAVLFGSYPEESDQCSSEAIHGAHTHAGVYRNTPAFTGIENNGHKLTLILSLSN